MAQPAFECGDVNCSCHKRDDDLQTFLKTIKESMKWINMGIAIIAALAWEWGFQFLAVYVVCFCLLTIGYRFFYNTNNL